MNDTAVKTQTTNPVIIDGYYDMFGDAEPHEFGRDMMRQAKEAGIIKEFRLCDVIHKPLVEVLHVRVLVDMMDGEMASMVAVGKDVLNLVFRDTDARVDMLIRYFDADDQKWEV